MLMNLLISVITMYIAATNTLADRLLSFTDTIAPEKENSMVALEPIPLPSQYDSKEGIPQILLENTRFQGASVIESQVGRDYFVTDPREALVNIYCTYTNNNTIRTTTGTGFFVHPDGVILTNAHVAQFLLLEDIIEHGTTECIIRTGDPATPRYRASLLYIPPAWIQTHATSLMEEAPIGTGERDYALLYVYASTDRTPMPAQFPALPVTTSLLTRGTIDSSVVAAGYPVRDVISNQALSTLTPTQATTTVSNLYTFGSNFADLMSLRGSLVGTHGSSGGPILNTQGQVVGLIATRGDDALDGEGSLRAITLSYIDRTITEETGFSFARNISGNIPYRAQIFKDTLQPFLTRILSSQLQ